MLRNDYRRALIMLRPLQRGTSGHVRLERRTLTASMRFTVQNAPPGVLHGLLMANVSGHWVKYRLGTLKSDSRGQSGMTASFDPRNLRGLDLDKYTLVALVLTNGSETKLLMTGMVNGYRDVNWEQAEASAIAEYAPKTEAAVTEEVTEEEAEVAEEEPEIIVEEPEVIVEEEPEAVVESEPEEAGEAEPTDSEEALITARELLKLDPDAQWPEDIEAVRELFERANASDSFRLEDFVFVDAPLPSEDGANGMCAIGLKAQNGKPVSVCYALPGNYSLEPPPGLEDYGYLGGWWYTVLDLV